MGLLNIGRMSDGFDRSAVSYAGRARYVPNMVAEVIPIPMANPGRKARLTPSWSPVVPIGWAMQPFTSSCMGIWHAINSEAWRLYQTQIEASHKLL
jgi:hypothetical protein